MPLCRPLRLLPAALALAALPLAAPALESVAAYLEEAPEELLALEGDVEWGAFLAAECATCHGNAGAADGIPPITGWPEQGFRAVVHAYRTGLRPNQSMQTVAARLSDEEIAALGAYLATLPAATD